MKKTQSLISWMIFLLIFVLLLAACSSETPVVEKPLAERPEESASPVVEVLTAEPETPVEAPETPREPETEPEIEAPEISQTNARWNSVSEIWNWVLIAYGDTLNPTVVEPDTYVTINFSNTDDQVNGSGGCNTYFTTYSADDDYSLIINRPIGATMMTCETGMEQETFFLGALETVTSYNITENGHLLLDYDNGKVYDEQLIFIPETTLHETVWVLTAYGDPDNLKLAESGVVTTAVLSADGTINGYTGCNNYAAGYQIEGNQLSISLPVMNLIACEKGMDQEMTFLQLLETAQSYRLGVNALEIITADFQVIRFSAEHLSLENVRWLLTSIDGQALPEGVNADVLFTPADSPAALSEENAINGSAGCNTFFGAYTLTGETFTAGPFGMTEMMCEDAVMQVEQAFLAGLESAQRYQITLNQLIIYTETGSLLFYADRMALEGPQWILTSIGSQANPQPPFEGAAFTAIFARQFGMPSGVKSGGTGCNDYTASYYAAADEIKINLPKTSQNTCSDGQMEAEQGYFLGLNAARDFRILGNEMRVYYDNYELVFVGSSPESEDKENESLTVLDGSMWWLTSIDTFQVVPGSEVTIAFSIDPDGSTGAVSGSSSCNTYSAEITGVFNFGPINVSSANCDTPEGVMEQESVYLSILQNANGVWIDGEVLHITANSETLYYTNSNPVPAQPLPMTAVIDAPSESSVGEMITFDGSRSSSNSEIISYQWDYGDGATGEGVKIGHVYNKAGTYDVILIIRDINGQTAFAGRQITIRNK